CIICGGCVDVCPMDVIHMVDMSDVVDDGSIPAVANAKKWDHGVAFFLDETACIRCALCIIRCPTDAITMNRYGTVMPAVGQVLPKESIDDDIHLHLSFFLFLVLTLTGTLLMFYYRPTTEWAYSDIKDLETVVLFGQLLRNMHRWAAHGMVITVFLHMIRVFYTGSYKPPREFNWVIGTLLFFFTILLSYTGYLLPWDQLAFWAVTVGYEIARATPVIGDEFAFVAFGGF